MKHLIRIILLTHISRQNNTAPKIYFTRVRILIAIKNQIIIRFVLDTLSVTCCRPTEELRSNNFVRVISNFLLEELRSRTTSPRKLRPLYRQQFLQRHKRPEQKKDCELVGAQSCAQQLDQSCNFLQMLNPAIRMRFKISKLYKHLHAFQK